MQHTKSITMYTWYAKYAHKNENGEQESRIKHLSSINQCMTSLRDLGDVVVRFML